MHLRKTFVTAMLSLGAGTLLGGCDDDKIASRESEIRDLVVHSNFGTATRAHDCEAYEWGRVCEHYEPLPILSRWDDRCEIDDPADACGKIAVQTHDDREILAALDAIESAVGRVIFDRKSIGRRPESEIERGILVSYGTATRFPSSTSCGEVTRENAPLEAGVLENGVWTGVLTVHLGAPGCGYDFSIVIHEFGHALGMHAHFKGFGHGPAWNSNAWNVLYSIYNSPIGASREQINAARVR